MGSMIFNSKQTRNHLLAGLHPDEVGKLPRPSSWIWGGDHQDRKGTHWKRRERRKKGNGKGGKVPYWHFFSPFPAL